jgi:enoyl-CoA hydratase/carnithine racemase
MSDRVSFTVEHGIADIRLNRPDKRNALDGEMFAAIGEAGERLKNERSVRAVVLSGEGRSFCAGIDITGLQQERPEAIDNRVNPGYVAEGSITHLGQKAAWVWQELPVPVIAAVHGHAYGGGLQIALGADIRIAHPDTQLSVREVYWGMTPDMTGTFTLSRLVRPDVAMLLTATATVITAEEAFRLGLVTRLSEDPYRDAMALAGEIAERSPAAVRGVKALLGRAYGGDTADQFAEERRIVKSVSRSPNQREAVRAHFEKRVPRFADA